MTVTADLVRREIELYRDVSEVWKADHEAAMACMDFQDLLAKGIAAFESINRIDEAYRRAVFSGSEFDEAVSGQITELYEMISEPCEGILETLARFERAGFNVDAAERFRSCCRELAGILTDPADFFSDEALVRMRDKAIDENQQGTLSEYAA